MRTAICPVIARDARSATMSPMVVGDHYFSAEPGVPSRPTWVEFQVGGRQFRLRTDAGVFSATRLDPGTAVLLRKAELPTADTEGVLLDLGCGYGPIGCALASLAPRATVYAVDVNARALDLVRANARDLGVEDRIVVARPDDVPDSVKFAQIWANPPIRVGKVELHALLDRWLVRLEPDGVGWLVVGRHLGADSLAARLTEKGWSVRRHASQKGYRVLRVTRPPAPAAPAAG
jgi:16S rRNA (guanine1207-N2)-methyltransferase